MVQDSIEVHPRLYTMTMVCPLCHQPITWNQAGVTTCPHCGAAFTIKPAQPSPCPLPGGEGSALPTNHYESNRLGPSETKRR